MKARSTLSTIPKYYSLIHEPLSCLAGTAWLLARSNETNSMSLATAKGDSPTREPIQARRVILLYHTGCPPNQAQVESHL